MPKVQVVIKTTQTLRFDSGDIPAKALEDLFNEHDARFGNSGYGPEDFARVTNGGVDEWVTDSVEVIEI